MEIHFEPFLHLVDVTADAALVAWGGFFFRREDQRWQLVDDEQLPAVADRPRHESIGARSEPYGDAVVEVLDAAGEVVARSASEAANHAWVEGLEPDTPYRYRVVVGGRPWADGDLWEWAPGADGRLDLRATDRRYQCRFRTAPSGDARVPVAFAVIGDYGIGIRRGSDEAHRQRGVARSLAWAVEHRDVRLVLTTGDNIYLGPQHTAAESGGEDDDWYSSFYEPYRHVISRVPVYPTVGNHDAADTETSDDRTQLADNFFLHQRFDEERAVSRSSVGPGLFYRFGYGTDVEFSCIDTSLASDLPQRHFFTHPRHRQFLEEAFPPRDTGGPGGQPRWRIPFSHHPPYTAGPSHPNNDAMIEHLVPLFRRSDVRLVLGGHEHNFQHAVVDGVHYLVTGAAGKLRPEAPTRWDAAGTVAWAPTGHLLVVELDGDRATVTPLGEAGPGDEPSPVELVDREGRPVSAPFTVSL